MAEYPPVSLLLRRCRMEPRWAAEQLERFETIVRLYVDINKVHEPAHRAFVATCIAEALMEPKT